MRVTHNQQGGAMVELAIAIPVFMGLLLAVVDFGLFFNNRVALQTAAYNYAKAAAANSPTSCTDINDRTIFEESVSGIINNPDAITVTNATARGASPARRFQVTLNYSGPATPLLSPFSQGLFNLYNDGRFNAIGVAHCP
ncbi:MAG: TadE family protein [Thermodesulfobacteriota bacterium]